MPQESISRPEHVKNALIKYILRRKLSPGDQLPAEAEMAEKLKVSRNTLREAYINLASAGVINRRHGIGTFVARIPVVQESTEAGFVNFPHRIRAAGYTPQFDILKINHQQAPAEVYDVFEIPDTPELLYLERVIRADSTPAVYLYDYFSPLFDKTECDWSEFTGDLIGFVLAHYNLDLSHIHSRYRALQLDEKTAGYLRLPTGVPVISSRSIVYTLDNRPVVYTYICFNPEIFELDAVRIIKLKEFS